MRCSINRKSPIFFPLDVTLIVRTLNIHRTLITRYNCNTCNSFHLNNNFLKRDFRLLIFNGFNKHHFPVDVDQKKNSFQFNATESACPEGLQRSINMTTALRLRMMCYWKCWYILEMGMNAFVLCTSNSSNIRNRTKANLMRKRKYRLQFTRMLCGAMMLHETIHFLIETR